MGALNVGQASPYIEAFSIAKGQGGIFCQLFYSPDLAKKPPFIHNHSKIFTSAAGSAAAIFKIIDREPAIDSFSQEGVRPEITGDIELRNKERNKGESKANQMIIE